MTDDSREERVDLSNVRHEARRLNLCGAVTIEFADPSDLADLWKTRTARCVGFAVDAFDRDCLLFNCLEPASSKRGHFLVRCIPAANVRKIIRLGLFEVNEQRPQRVIFGDPNLN